jgi:hypothetical protein
MKLTQLLIWLSLAISINAEIHEQELGESFHIIPHTRLGEVKGFIDLSPNEILFDPEIIELKSLRDSKRSD